MVMNSGNTVDRTVGIRAAHAYLILREQERLEERGRAFETVFGYVLITVLLLILTLSGLLPT